MDNNNELPIKHLAKITKIHIENGNTEAAKQKLQEIIEKS